MAIHEDSETRIENADEQRTDWLLEYADRLGRLNKRLLANGFSRDEAWELVKAYHEGQCQRFVL